MGTLLCLNVGFGDATIIKSQGAIFLIDCHEINEHSSYLPTDKVIHGVFITHQHRDHYSGLEFLKDNHYSIKYLIHSPYDRRWGDNSVTPEEWKEFNSLKDHFETKGTKLYSPYRQNSFDNPWWETHGIQFEIIGPHSSLVKSETREIHDASLVIKAILSSRSCLFAGDASDASLELIANSTKNFCNDILHASHHGSLNGANLEFIKKCNALQRLH
jgi:beta-lactamase superfamily II metal-dependent hydrolase